MEIFKNLFHTYPRPYLTGQAVVFVVSLAARVTFWLTTHWAIEDGMIIARMVKNLVENGEFTFNLGQRVSSSTSPIFGLMSALVAWTGISALDSARILGVIFSSLTAALLFRLLFNYFTQNRKPSSSAESPFWLALSGGLIFALLPPVVAYSVSGLETPVYMFFCAASLESLMDFENEKSRTKALILAAVTTVIRPDGAILLAVAGIIILIKERHKFGGFLVKALLALLIVLVPILIHYLYFGVPFPHSFLAKADGYTVNILPNAKRYLNQMLFAQPGGFLFYIFALLGLVFSTLKAPKLLFFFIWYFVYHLVFILRAPLFDWYLQVPLFVLCLFTAIGIFSLVDLLHARFSSLPLQKLIYTGTALGITAVLTFVLFMYAEGKMDYMIYEDEVRTPAGKWLTENTSPNDLAFTESLGFIGFYAHNSFVDWPGLASPQVPDLLKASGVQNDRIGAFDVIISTFKPGYLVLRSHEWDSLDPSIQGDYQVCQHFPTPPSIENIDFLIAGITCPGQ